jgi:hypothetical protein
MGTWSYNFGLEAASRSESSGKRTGSARLAVGDSYIDVVVPPSDSPRLVDFIEQQGEGLYLLSLRTNSLPEKCAALREAGYGLSESAAHARKQNPSAYFLPSQSDGVVIQLIERDPR